MTAKPGKRIVNSWNEFDPLKRVIVGRPDGSVIPPPEPAYFYDVPACPYPNYGPFPEERVAEARELTDNFVKILEGRGVVVDQPTPLDYSQRVQTPDWVNESMRGCMVPRDLLLPLGNEILEATMSYRSRWFEYLSYRPILEKYFQEDPNFLWEAAPKPRLTDETYEKGYWENFTKVWTFEEKMERARRRRWNLTEKEPIFDAADVARVGKDIFVLVAATTNEAGFSWLKRHFEPKGFRVHRVEYGGHTYLWHLDASYNPLCPGKATAMLITPCLTEEFLELHRINGWELVPATPPVRTEIDPWSFIDFECIDKTFIGDAKPELWLSCNTLMLDPKTVFVEQLETRLQDQLDKLGFEVIPVPFWQVGAFGGAFHCSTVDVYREGKCEDYFPKQIKGY